MEKRQTTPVANALRAQIGLSQSIYRGRGGIKAIAALLGIMIIGALNASIPVIHGTSSPDGGSEWSLQWFGAVDFGLADHAGLMAIILAYIIACAFGFARPFSLWHGEPPSNRPYFMSMPMNRRTHMIIRVASGAINVIMLASAFAVASIVGLLLGGRLSTLAGISAAAWLSFLVGPLALYLGTSIVAILSNRPGRVVMSTVVGGVMLFLIFSAINFGPGVALLEAISGGPFSYSALLVNGFFPSLWQNAPSWANPDQWPLVVVVWLIATSVAVFSAASWYRE